MLFVCWFAVYIPSVNRQRRCGSFLNSNTLFSTATETGHLLKGWPVFRVVGPSSSLLRPVCEDLPSAATTNLSCYKNGVQTVQLSVHSSVFKNSPLIVLHSVSILVHIHILLYNLHSFAQKFHFGGEIWGLSSLLVSPKMVVYIFVSHYLVVLDNFKEEDGIMGL